MSKLINNPQFEFTFDDVLLLPQKSHFGIENEHNVINLRSKITKRLTIDIPIVSAPMPGVTEDDMAIAIGKLGGLGFIHHFQSFEKQLDQIARVKQHGIKVAAAVADLSLSGVTHVGNLLKTGADLISVETAHAYNTQTIRFIRSLKKKYKTIEISVSLVVDKHATSALIRAGADNIRVGIGGGSHCTTRLVTGVGRPQLSAVAECYSVARSFNVPIMSDTGIKYPGDVAKAIAFGADSVMIGGLFSGTEECPGPIIAKNGKKYKYSWGMCTTRAINHHLLSNAVFSRFKSVIKQFIRKSHAAPESRMFEEGTEGYVPYKGSVVPIINNVCNGLRRSMWYQGATSLDILRKQAKIVFVSPNTMAENLPRI